MENIPLARQIELVFRQLKEEMSYLSSGTVFVHIRNDMIGKFGIRHLPLESRDGKVEHSQDGLTEHQQRLFRQMAVESLSYKKNWTHGEILFDFTLKKNILLTSIQFESSYNMSNLMTNPDRGMIRQ